MIIIVVVNFSFDWVIWLNCWSVTAASVVFIAIGITGSSSVTITHSDCSNEYLTSSCQIQDLNLSKHYYFDLHHSQWFTISLSNFAVRVAGAGTGDYCQCFDFITASFAIVIGSDLS
jgi:hypothetical protein